MTLRIVTAAVALPAILGILWVGTPAVALLIVVAATAAGWELADMVRARTSCPLRWAYLAWPVSFAVAGWLIAEDQVEWWAIPTVAGIGFVPALYLYISGRRMAFVYALAAGPYVGLALAHAPVLRSVDDGLQWVLFAVLVTFAADTGAMFTGIAIGRHRLYPRISPEKTWEGLVGGMAASGLAAFAVDAVFELEIAAAAAVVLGIALAVSGTLGDLGESALKRYAGVKDSGFLVPGHGGVLDRLDSLMPNLVIVYWVSEWSAT